MIRIAQSVCHSRFIVFADFRKFARAPDVITIGGRRRMAPKEAPLAQMVVGACQHARHRGS